MKLQKLLIPHVSGDRMDYKLVRTTCPYCGCGCEMMLEVANGKLIGTFPSKNSPMNRGKLCIKGWNAHEFVHSPERLTKPLVPQGWIFGRGFLG